MRVSPEPLYQSAPGPAGGSARSPGLPTFAFLPPPMVEAESKGF